MGAFTLKGGKCIHAIEFIDYLCFHWDWVDPNVDGFEHLRRDAPFWFTVLCGVAGASLGALATAPSKNKEVIVKSSIIWGIIGFIAGLATAEWD